MRGGQACDLARACTGLLRQGNDFPTIWLTKLKALPLVVGLPQLTHETKWDLIEIRLITGARLVFDGDARVFRLG